MSLRPLMKEALEAVENDETPIVIAPTGYGKTIATLPIHEYVKKNGLARGVIHVSPLRALVEKVFEDIFFCEGGIQAYGLKGKKREKKSPYLLRSPLAVTLDSFILSLYRLPIPEIIRIEKGYSAGHYYPILSAIKSSLIIFDEAHLALESNERTGYEALVAGVTALAKMGVRFMIETATLRPNVIGRLVSQMRGAKVKVLLLGEENSSYVKKLNEAVKGRAEIRVIKDNEFAEKQNIKWRTRIENKIDYDEIEDLAREKLVLVILNKVAKAQEVYRELRNRGVNNLVLIHGKLATSDREEAISKIGISGSHCGKADSEEASASAKGTEAGVDASGSEEPRNIMEKGVIVSTQVIEAGVDVNASVVFTEASPLESLIQRIGRICRRGRVLEECKRDENDKVIIVNDGIYGPYDKELVDSDLSQVDEDVDWRIPYGRLNYTDLLANAKDRNLDSNIPLQNVYDSYLTSDAPPYILTDILDSAGLCSIYGDLAPIFLYVEGLGTINVSLDDILKSDSYVWKVVEYGDADNSKPVIVILDEDFNKVSEGVADYLKRGNYANCRYLKERIEKEIKKKLPSSNYSRYFIGLKVKNYETGVGPVEQT